MRDVAYATYRAVLYYVSSYVVHICSSNMLKQAIAVHRHDRVRPPLLNVSYNDFIDICSTRNIRGLNTVRSSA